MCKELDSTQVILIHNPIPFSQESIIDQDLLISDFLLIPQKFSHIRCKLGNSLLKG